MIKKQFYKEKEFIFIKKVGRKGKIQTILKEENAVLATFWGESGELKTGKFLFSEIDKLKPPKQIKVRTFLASPTPEQVEGSDWMDLRCVAVYKVNIKQEIKYESGYDVPLLTKSTTKEMLEDEFGRVKHENSDLFQKVRFVRYKKGDFLLLDLGIAMELPRGYEANLVPRSSTFKNFTLLQTNSPGIIDESYKGDTDRWFMPVLAQEDGFIILGDRICQFRIQRKMPKIDIVKVDKLGNVDRGGHGSTGTK